MTTAEAAALLGLSPTTVRRQIENGRIKARKVGRDWHITPAAVEAYREASLGKRRATSVPPDADGTSSPEERA